MSVKQELATIKKKLDTIKTYDIELVGTVRKTIKVEAPNQGTAFLEAEKVMKIIYGKDNIEDIEFVGERIMKTEKCSFCYKSIRKGTEVGLGSYVWHVKCWAKQCELAPPPKVKPKESFWYKVKRWWTEGLTGEHTTPGRVNDPYDCTGEHTDTRFIQSRNVIRVERTSMDPPRPPPPPDRLIKEGNQPPKPTHTFSDRPYNCDDCGQFSGSHFCAPNKKRVKEKKKELRRLIKDIVKKELKKNGRSGGCCHGGEPL